MHTTIQRFATGLLISLVAPLAMAHPGHVDDTEVALEAGDLASQLSLLALQKEQLENEVILEVRGDYRFITSNGIPEHTPGRFPTRGNPNTISEQRHRYRVPLNPEVAEETSSAMGQPFGVGLNGVPFDPGTAEFWEPGMRLGERSHNRGEWNYDALSGQINLGLDDHNAHVQPTGSYHYHGIPEGLVALIQAAQGDESSMVMVGYAADGFPIYSLWAHEDADDYESDVIEMASSYQLKEGTRPDGDVGPGGEYDGMFSRDWEYVEGAGDLDECNGRFGVTPDYPEGTYYYVLTDEFPFIPRLFKGESDASFARRGRGGGGGGPGGPLGPRGEGGDRPGPPRGGRPPRRD